MIACTEAAHVRTVKRICTYIRTDKRTYYYVPVVPSPRHAFSWLPESVRADRQQRKLEQRLEREGLADASGPYTCQLCGARVENSLKLKRHFKQLHEREHKKRMTRLTQVSPRSVPKGQPPRHHHVCTVTPLCRHPSVSAHPPHRHQNPEDGTSSNLCILPPC